MKKIIVLLLTSLWLVSCSSAPTTTSVLSVGMECNYAPFNWMQQEESDDAIFVESTQSYCGGYDVLIAQEIADQLNLSLEIVPTQWEGLIPAIQSNSIDLIIAGMTDTEDRRLEVSFTEPYYYSDYVVLTLASSPLAQATSLEDLSGTKFVGQMATNYDLVIDQIPKVIHEPALATVPIIVNAIKQLAVDGTVVEKPVAQAVIATNPELVMVEFEEGSGFVQDENITTAVSIAVNKDNTELLTKVNEILKQLDQEKRESLMSQAMENQPSGE